MAKLLRANFARLRKSVSFWACMVSVVVITVVNYLIDYFVIADKPSEVALDLFFFSASNILFFGAIFVSLFLGTDYSCGTVRNKMIVGHSRTEIYFSNLITAVCGCLLMILGNWAAIFLLSLPTGGVIKMPADRFLLYAAVIFAAVIAAASIYVLLAMLITGKSTISTLSIVLSVAMIIGAAMLMNALNEPEYISNFEYAVNGESVQIEEKNPFYLEGIKRDIATVVNDILPGGQIIQIEANLPHEPQMMPLYSAGVTAVIAVCGTAAFRKKDIK